MYRILRCLILLILSINTFAIACESPFGQCQQKSHLNDACCGAMNGINYCDSSTGRLICNNGYTSSCYCTRHAVMNFQLLVGCCLWHGGVLAIQGVGLVVCNDGTTSEECTTQNMLMPSGGF